MENDDLKYKVTRFARDNKKVLAAVRHGNISERCFLIEFIVNR